MSAAVASASASPATVAATDWPTYHHDNARTGVAPGFPAAGIPSVAWTAPLDGAVYGQPLVVKKDPVEYYKKLRFHRGVRDAAAYGLDA